ncbi:hypothetical protein P9112_012419 [Eukaryota sp. TZLM1-RC]
MSESRFHTPVTQKSRSPLKPFDVLSSASFTRSKFKRSPVPPKSPFTPSSTHYSPKYELQSKHSPETKIRRYSYRERLPVTVEPTPDSPGPCFYDPQVPQSPPKGPRLSQEAQDLRSMLKSHSPSNSETHLSPNYNYVHHRLNTNTPVIKRTMPHNLDEFLVSKHQTKTELLYNPTPCSSSSPAPSISLLSGGEGRGATPDPSFFSTGRISPCFRSVSTVVHQADSVINESRRMNKMLNCSDVHKRTLALLKTK